METEEKVTQHFICIECGNPFDLTPSERDFFALKGFALPKRCKPCRVIRRKNNVDAYRNSHRKQANVRT